MSKFKIQGVGLDTTNINYEVGVSKAEDGYNYIYTSIPANNDIYLKNFFSALDESVPVITYVDFLDSIDIVIRGHLSVIERDSIDLLLIDSSCNSLQDNETLSILKDLHRKGTIKHFGIQNPVDLDEVKKLDSIMEKAEINIEYVCMPICPLEFNREIIDYCEETKLTVIASNPFGGYLSAARNIKAFSVPYLLSFAANYGNILLVSGRDMITAWEDKEYLVNLIDKESYDIFKLNKSISKAVKELKKAIHTSIVLDDDIVVPFEDNSGSVMNYDNYNFKIGSAFQKLPGNRVTEEGSLEAEVENLIRITHYPVDGDHNSIFTVAKYKVIEYLRNYYTFEEGWEMNCGKIGNSVLIVSVQKPAEVSGVLFWQKITPEEKHEYYLIVPKEGKDSIMFGEVKLPEDNNEDEDIAIEIE
jgi:hypothetical protein